MSAASVPDDVRARWDAARAGTLEVSPESLARHEGANAAGVEAYPPQRGIMDQVTDALGAGAAGVSRGVTGLMDLPGMVTGGVGSLAASGLEKAGIVSPGVAQGMRDSFDMMPMGDGDRFRGAASDATGGASEFKGDTMLGKYAGAVGEFLPGAMIGPGGPVRNLLQYGVAPGIASEAAGQATEGSWYEPLARMGAAMAAPFAVSGAERAFTGVRNALADWRSHGTLADELGVSRRAGRLVAHTLGMDDPERMRAALAASGPDGMLADAGPTAQSNLDAVMQAPGEGARTALRRIDARAEAAGGRLNTALDEGLTGSSVGAPSNRQFSDAATLQGDVRQATAGARKAVYDSAYAAPIDYASDAGRNLEQLLPRVPKDAITAANRLMQIDGHTSRQILADIADDGTVTFRQLPDVRQWDYIKRGLSQVASTGEGQGALGGQTDMGRAYQSLSRTIRQNLGAAVPEYEHATKVAGDVIGEIQSIQTGADMLKPGVTRAAFEASLDGMSAAERAGVKRGLRQQIDDTIANIRAVATDPNIDARETYKAYTMLTSRSSQDKMKLLLGDDWAPIKAALDDAASALGLRARVARGAQSFGRAEANQMINDSIQPGRIRSGEALGPFATPQVAWQNITRSTPSAVQKAKASVKNELAEVLTRNGGARILGQVENALAGARPWALPSWGGPSPMAGAAAVGNALAQYGYERSNPPPSAASNR
ncbi:hypothetical protein [Paracoccus sp. (in: a-proteobacteria)]|uniref:hypothetical protein n=1 Tax=Paracoccus sp. TaxID=267 RepID=UPI00289EAEC3|nr:hypothetical protein [Paracoccus sp. (in: a-proteobacteria)]